MIGIGGKLDKLTKIKILREKAKDYNAKYDDLVNSGVDPEEAAKTLQKQDFDRRHQQSADMQPYNISNRINQLGGSVNLGYTENHKTLTETKTMYQPMQEKMKISKATGMSASLKRSPQEQQEYNKMKARIKKDHLKEDFDVDFGDQVASDYKRNFQNDQKMKEIRETRDCKYNSRKNQLLWYAETYIKTKDSLRKC